MPDAYRRYQDAYGRFACDINVPATAMAATIPTDGTVRGPLYVMYVQTVIISFLTHVAGKVLTVQDSTGVKIVDIVDQAASGAIVPATLLPFDFGPSGTPLTMGASVQVIANTGGAGFLARVHIEGFQKLMGVGGP